MVRILTPLLRRNVGQDHTGPSSSVSVVDFNLPYNTGIMLKQYIAENENPVPGDDSILSMGISVNPDLVPVSLTVLSDDQDTLRVFSWESEITTTGAAGLRGWGMWEPPWSDFFKMKGFLIFGNISLHLISAGATLTQAGTHRLYYNRVLLDNDEIALLGQRARG